jgi:hypothetical protein
MGINKSNLYGVARGAIWGRFSNIAAVAVWWNTSPSVASIITRLSRRECPSGRQQKNSSNSRAVGNTETIHKRASGRSPRSGFPARNSFRFARQPDGGKLSQVSQMLSAGLRRTAYLPDGRFLNLSILPQPTGILNALGIPLHGLTPTALQAILS